MRDRNTFIQPKISNLARGTFGHIKRDNYEISRDLRREIDASKHISDRLCRTAQLMRKPKYSSNNSQSDLSDYASSISSSVKLSDQIPNPSCRHTTCIQHHTQPEIHLVGKNQRVDRQEYAHQELVKTSSVQSQNI